MKHQDGQLENLYKACCWKHHEAQMPWDGNSTAFWNGAANGAAMALKAKGLNDRQLQAMERDGIELGKSGRWDDLLDTLSKRDGSVPHED